MSAFYSMLNTLYRTVCLRMHYLQLVYIWAANRNRCCSKGMLKTPLN